VNVALQALAAVLLYVVARRLGLEVPWATLAGLLLAVHPVHCEAAAFVSARNNIFALCFALLALLAFARATARRSMAAASASALAFLLAVMSKEPGAMVLPVLVAWLVLPPLPGREAGPRRWLLLAPHAVALAAYVAMRTASLGAPVASTSIWPGLGERLAQNYYVIPKYLALLAWPADLAVYHDVPLRYWTLWWLPLAWVAIVAGLVVLVRRPSVPATLGVVWAVVNLAPIANVVPIPSTAMAERFFYASAAGLWLVAADAARRLAGRVPARAVLVAATAALVALAGRTFVRNRDWREDLTVFGTAVEVAPRSLMARFNYGNALKDAGDPEGARRQWLLALELAPEDPGTHAQLGTLAAIEGDWARAERHYRVALRGDPELVEARVNLARICERTGRQAEAIEHYRAALAVPPPVDAELLARAHAGLQRLGVAAR
jgi:tetratricopeptide (TPR) repeat protein